MRIAPANKGDEFELNVISLIDVMLTLLMFFVMTASFEQRALLKVTLPESQAAATTQAQRDPLIILVDLDGRYFVGKSEVLNPSLATLKTAIEQEAGSNRERPVTLRADGRTPHQAVVTAMDALGQLGFVHLTISTVPAKSGG